MLRITSKTPAQLYSVEVGRSRDAREVIPRPSWQSKIKIDSVNPQAPAGRVLPDISANAAGGTGYFLVAQGAPRVSGGTGAATPLWASLITRLLQKGKKVGFLTPRLYAPTAGTQGHPLGAVACGDITQGSNASGTTEGYSASLGFDAATGWGLQQPSWPICYLDLSLEEA